MNKMFSAFVVLGMVVSLTGCSQVPLETSKVEFQGGGTIMKAVKGDVTVHSYQAPEASFLVTSQIIETPNELVIVDVQFARPFAQEVKKYAESLGKPVSRIYITHSHPDHWFGLEYFQDVPTYALAQTAMEIEQAGDMMIKGAKGQMGDMILDAKVVPAEIVAPGKEKIDGLVYEFEAVEAAEGSVHLLVKLPSLGILVAQDLVFNKSHFFLGNNTAEGWIQALENLKTLKGYEWILVGHGEATANTAVYDMNIAYLRDAVEIMKTAQNGAELKAPLVEKYPELKGAGILDLSGMYLFGPPEEK